MSPPKSRARPEADSVEVHVADERELVAAVELRRRVFCEEQGVSEEDEYDGRDEEATHLVAVAEGAVVATCRLLREGATVRLGRMAVERAQRGRGVGTALLIAGERAARAAGATRISLNAQTVAQGVYARQGFEPRGEPFVEVRIEHVAMEKLLA